MSCLSSNPLLSKWLTPRVLQPSPLRESHPEIRCKRLLREEKHVIYFPTSAIALSYLASSIREANLVKTTFWYLLFISRERSIVLSWIPPKVTMLHGSQWRKFFRQNLLRIASIRKCLNQISLFDAPKLSSLMLSLMLENGWHASLPLKVFHTESRGEILIRGRAVTH